MDPALWIAAFGAIKSFADAIPNQLDRPDGAPSTAGIWTGAGAVGAAALAAKGGLGQTMKGALDPASAPILYKALALHTLLNMLNGFSTTQKGQDIEAGQGWYGVAQDELNDAKAGAGTEWEGRAAEDYSSRNTEQYDRVGRMAQADRDLIVSLREQGFEVERLRSDFGLVMTALIAAFPVAYAIELKGGPAVGKLLSLKFQTWYAGACLGTDAVLQSLQLERAAENAKEITRIVNEYTALTQEAEDALPYH
jgi:uncharacterized membrane protein